MSNETTKTAVPKLRFPEFEGAKEWKTETLGEISEIVRGGSPRPIENFITTAPDGLNWLKIGDVAPEAKYIFRTQQKVNRGALSKTREVSPGDLILSNSMSFGRPYIMKTKSCIHDGWIAIRQIADDVLTDYLYYAISSESSQSYFLANAAGAAVLNLNAERIKLLPLSIPPFVEQQKIAAILSSLDDLLTAQNAKLAALQAHKRGLMQGLFPAEGETVPKLRFPEFQDAAEWEKLPIGGKVNLLSGYPFKSSEISEDASGIPLMRGINVTSGFIRHNQDIDRFFLGDSKKLEKFRVVTDDLLIGMDGSKVGKNSALITEFDSGSLLIQRVARLRAKPHTSIQFVYQQINSSTFHAYVDRVNTSGGIPHISASQINEFEIYFPCWEEQQKIADCLTSLDNRITAQTQKIEALRLHKKGLMQGLFPTAAEPTA